MYAPELRTYRLGAVAAVPLPGKALLLPRHVEADKQMGLRRLGTKSSQTQRWRGVDSNHRFLGGGPVSAVCPIYEV
jgi:hypothetical protein